MSNRLLGGLLFAVACALGALAAVHIRRTPPPRAPLSDVAPGALVRVERRLGGETLVLVKRAGAWTAQPEGKDAAPAKPELCAALAYGAQRTTLAPKVSDDPASYETYGLSDQRAVRLRVFAEGASAPGLDVYLGAPAYGDALYARLADEAPVYVETGLPADALLLPATNYLTVGSGTKVK